MEVVAAAGGRVGFGRGMIQSDSEQMYMHIKPKVDFIGYSYR